MQVERMLTVEERPFMAAFGRGKNEASFSLTRQNALLFKLIAYARSAVSAATASRK
jgi:hypothetical protein